MSHTACTFDVPEVVLIQTAPIVECVTSSRTFTSSDYTLSGQVPFVSSASRPARIFVDHGLAGLLYAAARKAIVDIPYQGESSPAGSVATAR